MRKTARAEKRHGEQCVSTAGGATEKATQQLKQLWRDLYDREPPPYNKPFLVKRLAYRMQELAYGGLSARPRRS